MSLPRILRTPVPRPRPLQVPLRTPPTPRTFTTKTPTPTPTASEVAAQFLQKTTSQPPQTRTQYLDANQLRLLSLTLNRPRLYPGSPLLSQSQSTTSTSTSTSASTSTALNADCVPLGTPLPPGYHLVYFTPPFLESELGADGTDVSYNPGPPFTRRMWAGGEIRWLRRGCSRTKDGDRDGDGAQGGDVNHLTIGQTCTETTRVVSAEPKVVKRSGTGEEMVVVGVEKVLGNEEGDAVVDRRNWVFRKAISAAPAATASPPPPPPPPKTPEQPKKTHKLPQKQTPTTLFRFSALTFNPHKIHYSHRWAREVEGHKNIVVHGPLNLLTILNFWRDVRVRVHGQEGEGFNVPVPECITYRATAPLYADEEYEVVLEEFGEGEGEGLVRVRVVRGDGVVGMVAEIR